jgi:diguanylate cyclase (GGDEF)-like protein/PAS domain S-box-containing protein
VPRPEEAIGAMDGAGSRRTIGFLAPAVHGYFYGNVLTGVLETAAARGARVIAIQTLDAGMVAGGPDEGFTPQIAWQHIDALVVAQATVSDDYLREFAATGKPVIAVFRESEGFECPTVVPDNGGGIRLAVDHLIAHGHREIAFISRDPADADDWIRYRAYEETMLVRGLRPCEPVPVPWQHDETYGGPVAVRQLLERGPLPTAAVACTDLTAMALVEGLAEIGVAVPGDLAVIGFDDIADAATFEPPLSTIAQSFVLAGTTACDLAFDALDGRPVAPGLHCTPVTFINRESCGCPGSGADGAVTARSSVESICARFAAELADAVDGEGELSRGARRDLRTVGARLAALFTTVAHQPGTEVAGIIDGTTEMLRPFVVASPDPAAVVGAVRRFALRLAAQFDAAVAPRFEHLAFDIALRLLESKKRNLRGHTIAHQHVELHRHYYMIGTDLVRRRARGFRSLDWLETTEFRAGCFALWAGGRGSADGAASGPGTAALEIVSAYDRTGRYKAEVERCAAREFPPTSFVDLIDDQPGEHIYLYLLPVRFDGSDWGFLALTGPLDVREEAAFERYNHWAVLLTVALDHEQAMRSERALLEGIRASEERYALAAEAANDGLWDWSLTTGVVYYSSRWKALLGHADHEIAATAEEWLHRVHPGDRPAVDLVLAAHFGGQSATMELEYRLRTADGSYRWMLTHSRSVYDESGRVTRLIGSMTDITDRKLLEDRLRHDAHYDVLTGLPNRALFLDRLNRAIDRAAHQPGYVFAVVFLDLDGFKVINDSLGHQVGDEVLVRVAERLSAELRANDTVSRFGGDEFVLLLDDIGNEYDLAATTDRVLSVLSAPLVLGERTVAVSAAAGIAVSGAVVAAGTGAGGARGRSADEYLRDADTAMYRAKASGNGTFALFDTSMHAGAMNRLQVESDLRQAVADDQFELYYQPIVRLHGRTTVGLEALLRWRHPERGLVTPGEFLSIAETTGLVRAIGRWTVRAVCRQIRAWLTAFPHSRDVTVSVNLSNRQFWDPELRSYVRHALADYGVPASMLVFEVTEGVIMHNQDAASTLMRQLRDDAIKLHMDDFGTGYSSLSALHKFPIDALKIDRSFVARLRADPRSLELVRVMIAMGLNLGMEVIAEGVETEPDAATLAELGCPLVQGYLFSRPVPTMGVPRFFASIPAPA